MTVQPPATPFSDDELRQITAHGLTPADAAEQLALMRDPPPPRRLDRAAAIGDGIAEIPAEEQEALVAVGRTAAEGGRVSKFVPASGAATRMFRDLAAALDEWESWRQPLHDIAVMRFFREIDRLPFRDSLPAEASAAHSDEERARVLRTLLREPGLGYLTAPKALIPFHRHGSTALTPIDEHLAEAAGYCDGGLARVHFTAAIGARARFTERVAAAALRAGEKFGSEFACEVSVQERAFDTIAVTPAGELMKNGGGVMLFRPGGHGALLKNLERTIGDIVVVKNVDNVVPESRVATVVRWKQILVGKLVRTQGRVFELLAALHRGEGAAEAEALLREEFGYREALPDGAGRIEKLIALLDRPIRVCGMVRNQGEPGGGPFWVQGTERVSLQIVEASEIAESQISIMRTATHFNPVDLVCGLRNWRGEAFVLDNFADHSAVFLSEKSHEGRPLIALERPGLWNGGMARWLTIFVDVPSATFAPVKTVFDLLRPEHQ